jgi:hypothetical protein
MVRVDDNSDFGLIPLGVFFIKTASKQPLFKAMWILQTWGLF